MSHIDNTINGKAEINVLLVNLILLDQHVDRPVGRVLIQRKEAVVLLAGFHDVFNGLGSARGRSPGGASRLLWRLCRRCTTGQQANCQKNAEKRKQWFHRSLT